MGIQFPPYCFPLPTVLLYIYNFFGCCSALVKSVIKLKLKLNIDTEGAIESVRFRGVSVLSGSC